mgnify:CR=1 FL=1|tara:strand:- start:1872 stop:2270 length:399 start_codon:yes stop_codon:yes gene_type:complete
MKLNKSEITKRQQLILQFLNKCEDELTSQELHRNLVNSGKEIGLTTVYRNLQVLIKLGLVRSRHLPKGEFLYSPVERDIHHLTCVQCGETSKLEKCPVKKLNIIEETPKEFILLFHTLEFFGICQNCYQNSH